MYVIELNTIANYAHIYLESLRKSHFVICIFRKVETYTVYNNFFQKQLKKWLTSKIQLLRNFTFLTPNLCIKSISKFIPVTKYRTLRTWCQSRNGDIFLLSEKVIECFTCVKSCLSSLWKITGILWIHTEYLYFIGRIFTESLSKILFFMAQRKRLLLEIKILYLYQVIMS